MPYLSGVPAAGRSLDQRQLDLWPLAQHGAETHPQGLGVLGLACPRSHPPDECCAVGEDSLIFKNGPGPPITDR
jgi:hypothetical protein